MMKLIRMRKKKEKTIFDMIRYYPSNPYYIKYYLYKQEKGKTNIPKDVSKFYENKNHSCFSNLDRELKGKSRSYNRILFKMFRGKCKNTKMVSEKDIEKWIKLCQKHKTIPDNLIYDIPTLRFVIPLNNSMDMDILYIYLTSLRMIQEHPGFVTNMLIVNEKSDMNFYIAWLLCSKLACENSGHNIINANSYGIRYDNDKISGLDIRQSYKLNKLIQKKLIKATKCIYKGTRWNVTGQISGNWNSTNMHKVISKQLIHPKVNEYMNASEKDVERIYKEIKNI